MQWHGLHSRLLKQVGVGHSVLIVSKAHTPLVFKIASGVTQTGSITNCALSHSQKNFIAKKATHGHFNNICLKSFPEDGITEERLFNIIFCHCVIQEIPNKIEFFNKISKVIHSNGGLFILSAPFLHYSSEGFENILKKANHVGFKTNFKRIHFFSHYAFLSLEHSV